MALLAQMDLLQNVLILFKDLVMPYNLMQIHFLNYLNFWDLIKSLEILFLFIF